MTDSKHNSGDQNSGNWNSGYRNSGDRNSGNRNSGYQNSGNRNSGNWNSGNQNSGNQNSGYQNSGNRNSGNWNSGYRNSGDQNSGNWNSGYRNSGDQNSGYRNSGDQNSGDWNSGNRNSGYFNTDEPDKVRSFNKWCNKEEWEAAEKPDFLYFALCQWVEESAMTDQEKIDNPYFHTTGGYLKTLDYKEVFQAAWDKASVEDRELVKKLPNFDAEIFKEISGIDVGAKPVKEMTVAEITAALGYDVKIVK